MGQADRALSSRLPELRTVFLLIDIRHEPSANDKMMYDWIVHNGFEPVIIATKLDKINRSQKDKQIKIVKNGLNVLPGTPGDTLFRPDEAGAG